MIARIEIQDAELETGLRSIKSLYDTKTRSPTHNLGMGGSPFILFYHTLLSRLQLTNGKGRSIYNHNEILLSSHGSPHMFMLLHLCLCFPLGPIPTKERHRLPLFIASGHYFTQSRDF